MRRPSLACQVEGCQADLANLRSYFQRQHICEEHARADAIPDSRGGFLRFCQQCTKLEPLHAFEGTKRSCRTSLAKRHLRRSGGRRAPSAADLYGTRSYSSTDVEGTNNGDAAQAASMAAAAASVGGPDAAALQRVVAAAAAAAAGERGSPTSAASRPPEGADARSSTQLAALLEVALPPLPAGEAGARGAAASAAAAGGLTHLQQGPVPLSVDLKGSSIMEQQGDRSVHMSAHVPPLRPVASHGAASLPSLAALTGHPPAGGFGDTALPASLLAALGTAPHSSPGGTPSAATATALQLGAGRGGGDATAATAGLLPYLASMLSSRASTEPASAAAAAAGQRLAGGRGGEGGGKAPSLLAEAQQQQDMEALLTALQMLQQLQGLIGGIVVSQLQQQLARVEAAALLDQQLLPLLAGIQARQAASADAQQGGVQRQLDGILGQLRQLVGVLQAPPQQPAAQALPSQPSGGQPPPRQAQQVTLQQLLGAQQAAAQQLGPQGGVAGPPALPTSAAQQAAPAGTGSSAPATTEQLQALMQRLSPMLKQQG